MAQMEDMSCQSPQKISDGNDSSDDPLGSKKNCKFHETILAGKYF